MIEISWPLLLIQAVTFLAAMVIVWKLFWRPLTGMMQARSQKIAQDLQQAEAGRREIEAMQAEYQAKMVEIGEKTRQELLAAAQQGNRDKEEIVKSAREEAQRILEKSRQDLERERKKVVLELRQQVSALSLAAAERLLGQAIDPALQKRMFDDFIKEIDGVGKIQ